MDLILSLIRVHRAQMLRPRCALIALTVSNHIGCSQINLAIEESTLCIAMCMLGRLVG